MTGMYRADVGVRKLQPLGWGDLAPSPSTNDQRVVGGYKLQNPIFFFVFCLFSICFEWACQDFYLLKANLGPLCMPYPGIGSLA